MTANIVMFDALRIRRENRPGPDANEQRIQDLDDAILTLDIELTRLMQDVNGRRRLRATLLAELELRMEKRSG